MPSSSSHNDRDQQLLSVGKRCHYSTCGLVDFLPFKCQHCKESFCQSHFLVASHECPEYDESKHNRVAPSCPLCNVPVTIPIGQDPNIRMEAHLQTECSVTTGNTKKKSLPVCRKVRCGKTLYAPIECSKCRLQFCPAHRFPLDHACTSLPSPSTSSAPSIKRSKTPSVQTKSQAFTAGSRLLNLGTAAVKKSMDTASGSIKVTSPPQVSGKPIPAGNNPFSKTDSASSLKPDPDNKSKPAISNSRAKSERESKRKAMQERAKKGLLSEEEQSTLDADLADSKDSNDCLVM